MVTTRIKQDGYILFSPVEFSEIVCVTNDQLRYLNEDGKPGLPFIRIDMMHTAFALLRDLSLRKERIAIYGAIYSSGDAHVCLPARIRDSSGEDSADPIPPSFIPYRYWGDRAIRDTRITKPYLNPLHDSLRRAISILKITRLGDLRGYPDLLEELCHAPWPLFMRQFAVRHRFLSEGERFQSLVAELSDIDFLELDPSIVTYVGVRSVSRRLSEAVRVWERFMRGPRT